MQSLSLEKTMTPFEQERVAGQPVRETTVLDELPRALEDIPDDVLLAYAKRRLEAKEPKRMPAGHRNQEQKKGASFTTIVETLSCAAGEVKDMERSKFFGKRLTENIRLVSVCATALLDTGSEVTIIPLKFFKMALDQGIDLDGYVERVDSPEARIRDASGNVMDLVDSICVEIELKGVQKRIACYVGRGLDDLIILDTNALEAFGLELVEVSQQVEKGSQNVMDSFNDVVKRAIVKDRVYVPPGSARPLTLVCARTQKATVLWSSNPFVCDGLCAGAPNGEVEIPVVNRSNEPIVFRAEEDVGVWGTDQWLNPNQAEATTDMLDLGKGVEHIADEERIQMLLSAIPQGKELKQRMRDLLEEFSDVFALSDRELTQTDLVVHEIDTGDSRPIKQKTRPVPIGARQEFKGIIKGLLDRGNHREKQFRLGITGGPSQEEGRNVKTLCRLQRT
ncbi:unnamed protein product [Heligmosomoides polygyrus]|uniref:Peptidase A2 domain-containing protein n=1 Tax=Heligmosomoides polygyrus TaxID=6339 RepID=A0A183GWI0_HELPZ|nr:unnamed protein product [Heligmosomoides polygyrus]